VKTIFLIAAGGTIEKSYCERTGSVSNFGPKIECFLAKIWLPQTRIDVVSLLSKDSREPTRGILSTEIRSPTPMDIL
jgi:hypothetical protein